VKKLLIFLYIFIFLLSTTVIPAFADASMSRQSQAEILEELGLFTGSDKGYDLDRKPTRAEAAVMLVRLLGKESDAKSGEWPHPFSDVPAWCDKHIGYLYSMGITKGVSPDKFGSTDECDVSMYATFVLRALNYDDGRGDFKYKNSLSYAFEIGLIDDDAEYIELLVQPFLRGSMVGLSYNALKTRLKQSTETLAEKLIRENAISRTAAISTNILDTPDKPDTSDTSDPLALDKTSSGLWELSAPEEQGMDPSVLNKMEDVIKNNYPAMTSILVARHGRLVYEKYFGGMNKDRPLDVFSVVKSVVSALTGIAIQKGHIKGVDRKLSEFYPEYMNEPGVDPRVRDITIEHILTMTDGLESVGANFDAWLKSDDWVREALKFRMLSDPGTKFIYNTGIAHVMGGIIAKTSGTSLKDFADKNLFGPLGIHNYIWQTDTSGRYSGGHLLYMTPRDMVKIGYLYLMNGKWNGTQILPEQWIKESFTEKADSGDGKKYGYFWWLYKKWDPVRQKYIQVYSADGYGSQHIFVIPEHDLVVVYTCEPYSPVNKGEQTKNILTECIFPAIK
jgi:CubicO group peptidase (beta-lactamase class C family)